MSASQDAPSRHSARASSPPTTLPDVGLVRLRIQALEWARAPAHWGLTVCLVATLAVATAQFLRFPRATVDDAFITYRYAENLARHGELTFNVGGNPVEGYTGV